VKNERVAQVDGDHERFELMIAVGPFAQDFQVEIHLGRRPNHHVVGEVREQHG